MADKQHRERIEELRKDIETGVKELRDSGTWQRYLDFMGRFHQYSWNNILLMLMQSNGNSSLVAGFRQWQTRGRVVRKGEHGMKIFGFSARTVKDEDGNPQLDENGDPIQKVWYPILTVFDVSQTDPIDKETDPIEQMKPSELEGADVLGLVGRMTKSSPRCTAETIQHLTGQSKGAVLRLAPSQSIFQQEFSAGVK